MSALIPRSGLNRTMSLAIRYGPRSFACSGFTEILTEQHHATITLALKHLRTPEGQPGKLLRILLSWVQAYTGTSKFIWTDTAQQIPKAPAPWVNGVRNALHRLNGRIVLDPNDSIMPQALRENEGRATPLRSGVSYQMHFSTHTQT